MPMSKRAHVEVIACMAFSIFRNQVNRYENQCLAMKIDDREIAL